MSKFKDFICNSEIMFPRTITYGDWSVISAGSNRGNRHVYIRKNGAIIARLWIYIRTSDNACAIRPDTVRFSEIYQWLDETCSLKLDYWWNYKTWEEVDKFVWKVVDYIRNRS